MREDDELARGTMGREKDDVEGVVGRLVVGGNIEWGVFFWGGGHLLRL